MIFTGGCCAHQIPEYHGSLMITMIPDTLIKDLHVNQTFIQ